MRRAVGKRGGGAVARQLVEEELGVARGVRGIGEFLLFDEGVFLQPFEELRAIGRDHLRLRVVDMGVDESGQNQRVGVMFDRSCRRQPRHQLGSGSGRLDAAVLDEHDTVFDVAIALRIAGAVRRAQKAQKPAANGAHVALGLVHFAAAPAASHDARTSRS